MFENERNKEINKLIKDENKEDIENENFNIPE